MNDIINKSEELSHAELNPEDEHSIENKILKEKDESELKSSSTDTDLIECAQYPFITKKSGRHQLHPFTTPNSLMTTSIHDEGQEILLNVQQLGELGTKSKENEVSSNVLPMEHQMHPASTPKILTVSSSAQKAEEPSGTLNKKGTLSRIMKNLTGTNRFSQEENAAACEYNKERVSKQNGPRQIEGLGPKPSGTFGKMLNKMNNVSKESKTNISKAIHRISDAFTNGPKNTKKEEQTGDRLNMAINLNAREKCASLGRKVSSLGSHFSKQNLTQEENSSEFVQTNGQSSESKIEGSVNVKQSFNEKASTLTRKISSIGSHFRNKTLPNSGSGEVANPDSTANENFNSASNQQNQTIAMTDD